MFNLDFLLRENIKTLIPYSSARDEFSGDAKIFLDANENSLGSPLPIHYNRYPDPLQKKVKEKLSEIKGVPSPNIFLGNGSDECIDILIRAFCEPAIDNVIVCPPTYGMYEVSARINNISVKKVSLTSEFQLDLPAIEKNIDDHTKMIFLCSPNNPTGNSLSRNDIEILLNNYFGIVVLDEAYINFSRQISFVKELEEYPGLVILHTLSKAWGLAALRVGIAFASADVISVMNKIKPPYNISQASQELVLSALEKVDDINEMIRILVQERNYLEKNLRSLPAVLHIYPSEANFLLVRVTDANKLYDYLMRKGIVVRNRSNVKLCESCLRITVGTSDENLILIEAMRMFEV